MTERVQIATLVCASIVSTVWMIRSAIMKLAESEKDTFTFEVILFGQGLRLYRGEYSPRTTKGRKTIDNSEDVLAILENGHRESK